MAIIGTSGIAGPAHMLYLTRWYSKPLAFTTDGIYRYDGSTWHRHNPSKRMQRKLQKLLT